MSAASTKRFIATINEIYKAFEQRVTGITAFFATFVLQMHHDISPQRGERHGHETPIYLRSGPCDGGIHSD
jgi:hypothetical protein